MSAVWTCLSTWLASLKKKVDTDTSLDDEIGSEAPIRTRAEDRLRRADYADRIAAILSQLSLREGRVFSIRGGWGFGKSSLKNLITEQLKSRNDGAIWLDFNPWQWGDGNAIARALFGQIADRLGGTHSKEAYARAKQLRRYGSILTGASAPLKTLSSSKDTISFVLTNTSVILVASAVGFDLPVVAKVVTGLWALGLAVFLIGRAMQHFGQDHSSETLDQVREDLENRLRELKHPLIVFVDDIDRLEPEQIREVLKQVKANANLPNIVFVLLFQSSIVEKALDPVANGDGRAFLEKIVQANFDLPAVPTTIVHTLFGEELSQLAGRHATEANGFSETRWGNAYISCIQPYIRNLRDTRRLLSSIAVHMPMHAVGDVFEVNIVDFLLLEVIRVFEPDLHKTLLLKKALMLQEGRYRGDNMAEDNNAAAQRLLENVPEERRGIAKEVVTELFPSLERAFGGSEYGDDFQLRWLAEKRVCTSRYFPRYFELQTALGEISEAYFLEFLDAAVTEDTLNALIAEVEADGLLLSLVARLDESVDRLPVESAAVLLPGLFSIAQKLVHLRGNGFSSPWIAAWRSSSWFLRRIPVEIRGRLAMEALRQTKALSVAGMLIHLSDPSDYKKGSGTEFDPALDLDTVHAMKAVWLQLIRSRAEDDLTLIDESDLVRLLYLWEKYAGACIEPQKWVAKVIQTDESFAKIATRLMSTGTTHSWGDKVSLPHHTFNKDTIEDFIGIGVAKARCDSMNFTDFPDDEKALNILHRHLEVWLGIKEGDPIDFM